MGPYDGRVDTLMYADKGVRVHDSVWISVDPAAGPDRTAYVVVSVGKQDRLTLLFNTAMFWWPDPPTWPRWACVAAAVLLSLLALAAVR